MRVYVSERQTETDGWEGWAAGELCEHLSSARCMSIEVYFSESLVFRLLSPPNCYKVTFFFFFKCRGLGKLICIFTLSFAVSGGVDGTFVTLVCLSSLICCVVLL